MSDRRSVILIFYDLPMLTGDDRKEYSQFKKRLKQNGYINIQKSVALKLVHNSSFNERELQKLSLISPPIGSVYAIPVCISDFKKLTSLSSKAFNFNYYIDDTVYL